MEELQQRLVKILEETLEDPNGFDQVDFDEMKILYSRCKQGFPVEFQRIFEGSGYPGSQGQQRIFAGRLLRVLEIIASLPEEFRLEPEVQSDSENTLIPMFSLEKKDISRVVELCSQMRKIVFVTADFDSPHRLRLLNRIAAIEAEVLKPQGIFDVIRGGIDDVGETLGKFGVSIKPLTDRMAEVVGIARRKTKEYDQLPSPDEVKKLPPPTNQG